MAYNPFNIFRRNQKAIFAVITVIIMFVFVMSSGLGGGADFFDWLPQWLGSKQSKKGEVICKLDGSKIYQSDLEALNRQRVLANRFMYHAAGATVSALGQYIDQQIKQVTDPESMRLLNEGPAAMARLNDPQLKALRLNPQLAPFLGPQIHKWEETAQAYNALANSTTRPAEKEIVRAQQYHALLQMQMGQTMMGPSRGEFYFSNAPNATQTDRLNFMLWQKKADQLGINYTSADINQLIQKEFFGFFRAEVAVRKELQQQINNFSLEACLKAIGEEFRVRTAQQVILGPGVKYPPSDKMMSGPTTFNTPYELFEFYRDKCSPTDYEVVPVPAAGFVDKVVGEPTDDELKRLYDQYKDDEPNPGRETPGFKTPRRIKLEWISATGTEPYYEKLAEESLKIGELQAKIGSMMTVPIVGSGPGWVVAATAPLLPKDPLLMVDSVRFKYANSIADQHKRDLDLDWTMPSFVTRLLDTSVVRPTTLVAALGGCAGGSLTFAGPITGFETLKTAAVAFELRDRIRAGMPLVTGVIPGPGILATMIGSEASLQAQLPKPLPIEVFRPELIKELTEQTAKHLLVTDLKTFSTKVAQLAARFKYTDQSVIALQRDKLPEAVVNKLNALKGKEFSHDEFVAELTKALTADELKQYQEPIMNNSELVGAAKDKGPVQKYIAEFAAARGWQRGASEKLQSEWTLEDDPGLAPLRAVLTKSPHANRLIQFGKRFFWSDDSMNGPKNPVYGIYKPEYYPSAPGNFESPKDKPEPKFVVWRTEETRPQAPAGFLAAKEMVRAAWKRNKARELAKNRAETLAAAMRASAGDVPDLIDQNFRELANGLRNEITDPKAKERVQMFPINDVCPLVEEKAGGLKPFALTESNNIPFPSLPAMTDTLLAERTNPPKTTFIMVDKPKDTYYVVTLKRRDVKKVGDFKVIYENFALGGMFAQPHAQTLDSLMERFREDAQKKIQESIIGLLKQEFKFEATDEQKKKLEESDKRGSEES